MQWKRSDLGRLPVLSWCGCVDTGALKQAGHLADHPASFHHVALMPDCHVGFGMPIGGVIACPEAVIPNAVGVDIGCGMGAAQTNWPVAEISTAQIRAILDEVKRRVPAGEGQAHRQAQAWTPLDQRARERPGGTDDRAWDLAYRNLGTLGGGNHFIEIQAGDDGWVWLMIHSGSRNLGLRIAEHYHRRAESMNTRMQQALPHRELAYLPLETDEGRAYIRDMNFALAYAQENRRRIMEQFKQSARAVLAPLQFQQEINIHHNYAAPEEHFGRTVWIHRKGATSAREGEIGIIPGSMGTPSYIVRGRGRPESFQSCSHGAGRAMGRMDACRRLTRAECDAAMRGVVFDGWQERKKTKFGRQQAGLDFEEAPPAYKNIKDVIAAELDLVEPLVKLRPLGVVKG